MKHMSARRFGYGVNVISLMSLIIIGGFMFMSFSVRKMDDFWKQLGITQEKGSEKIKNSFMNGYLDYYGVKNFRALTNGDRKTVTKDLLTYAKSYLNSPAVKAAYAEEISESKPPLPELSNLTKDEIRKREVEKFKTSIEEAEKILKQFPEMEKNMRASINELHKTIKEFEAPNSKMVDLLHLSQTEDNKYKEARYAREVEEWQESYPSDHRIKLRSHLEKYLSIAATVNFDAVLKEQRGKQVFVKSEYENKDEEWKMIFRAGKEVYEVAKPFVEQWLKELPVK